jgi:olfactory receptor
MCIKPSSRGVVLSKGMAVLNTSVAPLLDLFIYTFRNKQLKKSFNDITRKTVILQ